MGETSSKGDAPVVLITGASAGIGAAIVHRFADAGWRIVALARRPAKLAELEQAVAGKTTIVTLAADVAQPDTGDRAVALAIQTFGRLDCLINNAGAGKWAPVHLTDDATMEEVFDISLKGPFRFCRAALGVMKPGSSIINVGSVFGIVGGLNGGVYCAAKAGLIGLTQTMAAQYGADGIRTNVVAPGVIRTDMTEGAWQDPGFRRLNLEQTPADREGSCEDVANTCFFLASKEGSYINGQTIALDGGWTTTRYLPVEALISERLPLASAAAAA